MNALITEEQNILQQKLSQSVVAESDFTKFVLQFMENAFLPLQHLRPGKWKILSLNTENTIHDAGKFEYLAYLQELVQANQQLKKLSGQDFCLVPDILIYQRPYTDEEINATEKIVDDSNATQSKLREKKHNKAILRAVIITKWKLAEKWLAEGRLEALAAICQQAKNSPRIFLVTGERKLARLAALAYRNDWAGVYQTSLYELAKAIQKGNTPDTAAFLQELIEENRVKDIADLPLDLCL